MNKKVLILIEKWGNTVRVMTDEGVDVEVLERSSYYRTRRDKNDQSSNKIEKEFFVPFSSNDIKLKNKWSQGFYNEIVRHRQSQQWQQEKIDRRVRIKALKKGVKKIELIESLPENTPILQHKLIKNPVATVYWYLCTLQLQRKKVVTVLMVTSKELTSSTQFRIKKKNNSLALQQKWSYRSRFSSVRWNCIQSLNLMTQEDKARLMEALV